MSEILKDRAVILRTYDFSETSMVVVAFTRTHGKLRLLAKGAKRKNSPFAGCLRTGSSGEIVYYYRRERGLHPVKEISSRSVFDAGGESLEKLCLLQAGIEIVDRSLAEQEADERIFDSLERFMDDIPSAGDPWLHFFALEVHVLEAFGLLPSMAACQRCRKILGRDCVAVNPSSGEVTCRDCAGEDGCVLSPASFAVLSRMAKNRPRDIGVLELDPVQRREIGELLHRLLTYHMDGYRLPNSLRYIKEVNSR